jgi:hypothetical protein
VSERLSRCSKVRAMPTSLQDWLSELATSSVAVSPGNGFPEPGQASAWLVFVNGTTLQAEYWRLIEDGAASFSSFDHQQTYGLPAAIDAIEELRKRLSGREVVEALHDQETGDLVFKFTGNTKLQILNVTGYEIWEMRFPNGAVTYSNRAK